MDSLPPELSPSANSEKENRMTKVKAIALVWRAYKFLELWHSPLNRVSLSGTLSTVVTASYILDNCIVAL